MVDNKECRFILFSSDNEETAQILQGFTHHESFKIEIVDNLKTVMDRVTAGEVNCFLFNVAECEQNAVKVIGKIKDAGPKLSVVVLSKKVQKDAIEMLRQMRHVVVLEKPLKEFELDKICHKISVGGDISQRQHKRFDTLQKANLEKLSTGEKIVADVYNISKSGAYVEVSEGRLTKGEVLKMTIQLDKLSKAHTMHAEVIWTVQKGFSHGKPGAGLRFMNVEEVYTTLLERI